MGIFYDGAWLCRLDDMCLPVSNRYSRLEGSSFPSLFTNLMEASRNYWFYLYKPSPGDVIVDVGAGRGIDTYMFSKAVGDGGKVLAIEAHPRTFKALASQCRRNRLRNVILRQVAVTDGRSPMLLTDRPNDEENTLAGAVTSGAEKGTVTVPGSTLDEVCREAGFTRIDFLKMNIEGAERLAIASMRNVLEKTRFVCIACHDFLAGTDERMATKNLVIEYLRGNGFHIVDRNQDSRPQVRDHVHASRG